MDIAIDEEVTSLSDIDSKGVYGRVSVRVKVSIVSDPTQVPTGKTKKDIIVVDGTGTGKCVLWEDKIGSLKEGKCYLFNISLSGNMVANFCPWLRRAAK